MYSALGSIGAALGALAVAAGAFGAHALKDRLTPRMLEVWQTAAFYHLVHAVLLMVIAHGLLIRPGGAMRTAAGCTLAGMICFSGSLYALALTGKAFFGPITPFGGLLLICGWVALAVAWWGPTAV